MIDNGGGAADGMVAARVLRAARTLRDTPVAPSDAWRREVLEVIERGTSGAPASTSAATPARPWWSMHPVLAVAAGLFCMLIGAAAALGVRPAADSGGAAASAADGAPVNVRFTFTAPAATNVVLVGDFNGWSASTHQLRRAADGRTWEVQVPLMPGRYAYSFVVDGAFVLDPAAPRAADDDFGSPNSIVMVRGT
ncbi:MAG: isoamylase early set domain-containing protein [Gemmatimonadaceae bacterium]